MADSSLERKKKLVAEFEQIVRNWPSGKPGSRGNRVSGEREKRTFRR